MERILAAPSTGIATCAEHLTEREAALAHAEQLADAVQDGPPVSAAAVRECIAHAEHQGWPEVARAGRYAELLLVEAESEEAHRAAIERLLERSLAEGDEATAALMLAKRARMLTRAGNPSSSVVADRDLARASVLVDSAAEASAMLARAHINCAIAYGQRDFWELEHEHYQAAEEILTTHRIEGRLRHVILYNHAEMQLNWACALRELGDTAGLEFRARAAASALAAADIDALPASWRDELAIFMELLAAIAPGVVRPPRPVRDPGPYAGYIHLARALTLSDRPEALEEARLAVAGIDPDECPNPHNLALSVAAEIESALAGADTAGLTYARHLVRLRWATRESALASMQSLLQAERLSTEHALLSQHAYLDDLTRLGNRRAMARYIERLAADGVSSVAMILLDIDRFKDVNDTYGHAVGDDVLVRVAALLRAAVRADDVAVRLGGDEFVLLLAAAHLDTARRRAQAILAALEQEPWAELAPGLNVRASVGVTCGDPHQLDRLSGAADSALYRSKAAGGSRLSEA